MAQRFVTRSQAREYAVQMGWSSFRTSLHPTDKLWVAHYEPGVSPAAEWAKGKDFVAWVETDWFTEDLRVDSPPIKRGILVVTCRQEELADENIPADFVVEPITPELFEKPRAQTAAKGAARAERAAGGQRARSDVESPVKLVWRLADEMKGADRKEVIAACVAQGVNKATAQTQYYRWDKARKGQG